MASPSSPAGAPSNRYFSRVGAGAGVFGLLTYAASVVLHPGTPPHETEAAFADYASQTGWALIHLAELLGFLLFGAAVLALAWRLRRGAAGVWAALGGAAIVVSSSVYAVFTAVDGVALGILVERWAGAGADHELLFETAFAVRQVEAGLFSLQWFLFGLAAGLIAMAFFCAAGGSPFRFRWLALMGWLSVVSSVGTIAFAVVQAETGFSETSMAFQAGLYPPVLWVIAVVAFLNRFPEPHPGLGERLDRPVDQRAEEPVT